MSLWLIAGGFLVLGVGLTAHGLWRVLARGRLITGSVRTLSGGFVAAVGGIFGLIGLNLQTYHALTLERPVAELRIEQTAPQRYAVTLLEAEYGTQAVYDIAGDQWQLEARVLRFHPWASILGLNSLYRLDRITGRFADLDQARDGPRTVYALTDEPGVSLAELARHPLIDTAQVVDTSYGNSVFMPLADGATYEVMITQDSLLPRPSNAAARKAVAEWR